MKIKHCLYLIAVLLIIFLNACKMYYIPVDSLKQQFAVWDTSKFKQVKVRGSMGDVVKYKIYPIDFIKCVDKDGKQVLLKNSPAVQIRFTDINNKRTTFYFDRTFVRGDSVRGVRSRFLPFLIKTLPLNKVKLIEVQDGGKNFQYVN